MSIVKTIYALLNISTSSPKSHPNWKFTSIKRYKSPNKVQSLKRKYYLCSTKKGKFLKIFFQITVLDSLSLADTSDFRALQDFTNNYFFQISPPRQ